MAAERRRLAPGRQELGLSWTVRAAAPDTSTGQGGRMPYAEIDDGVRLYYELTGPEDAPVVLQFGGGLFGRHNFGLVNDGFRESFRLLVVRRARLRRVLSAARALHDRRVGRRRRALLDAVGLDTRLRPRHLDGRHDRDRLHRAAPGADDRGLRRRRVREARPLPAHALPRLAPDGRDDAVGRVLRSRHDAGRRRAVLEARRGETSSSSSAT